MAMNSTPSKAKIDQLRSRRRRRGTAFAETAIMLPFLVIVFSGIVYLGRYYMARQQALLTVRSCAWQYAYNSCATLPVGCPQELFTDHRDPPDPTITNQIDQAKQAAAGGNTQGQGGQQQSRTNAFADQTGGLVDEMVSFVLGEGTTAKTVRTVTVPPLLPVSSGRAPASYYLPCNTKERDPLEMAIDLFKALVPGL
jgi:hypothetical protein